MKKVNRVIFIAVTLLLMSALLLGACAKAPAPATPAPGAPAARGGIFVDKPEYVLKIATWIPTTHQHYNGVVLRFVTELEYRSGGRIKLDVYPGGLLGAIAEQYPNVRARAIDIGIFNGGSIPYSAQNEVFYLAPDIFVAGVISHALEYKYFGPTGIKTVDWRKTVKNYSNPLTFNPGVVGLRKEVRTLADWKGLKIGSGKPAEGDTLRAMGALPVNLTAPEAYQALATGAVDGFLYGPTPWVAYGITEGIKYWTPEFTFPLGIGPDTVIVNLDTYNSLTPDLQKVLDDLAVRAGWWADQGYEEMAWRADKEITAAGVKKITVDPAELDRWNGFIRKYQLVPAMAKLDKAGYPAQEMYDLIDAILAEYKKIGPFWVSNYEFKAWEMLAKYVPGVGLPRPY